MYQNPTSYRALNVNKKLSIIVLLFTFISAITKTSGEFYCSPNGPFSDAQKAESVDGWQQWKDLSGTPFYINHKTKEIRENDPSSWFWFLKSSSDKKIEIDKYPEGSFVGKKTLFDHNLEEPHLVCFNINVKRSTILEDSYRIFGEQGAVDDLKRLCKVKFEDDQNETSPEPMVKEWFQLLFNEIFDKRNGFFRYADKYTLEMEIIPESKDLSYFKFFGRIMGEAVRRPYLIDVKFVKPYYQIMLGQPIQVQGENTDEATKKAIREKYLNPVEDQLCAFLEGFAQLVPLETLRIFTADELQLVVGGESTIDVSDWKRNTRCLTDSGSFWHIMNEFFSNAQRKRLLQFTTGSPRVPVGGFKNLQPLFKITENQSVSNQIPEADQKNNRLILPYYSSEEEIRYYMVDALQSV